MRGWLKRTALSLGYTLHPSVGDAKLLELIRTLRPRCCPVPLIRIGGDADGGYLVPDDLGGIEYCFSPGVNVTADFENALAERGIRSFLADFSVTSPPIMRPEFVFDRKYIGADDDETFMTLGSWKQKYLPGYGGEMILQMDIEGGEYEVLLSTPVALLARFRVIVLELHHLQRLFDPFAFSIMQACFQKLLRGFYVVHSHPNNCSGVVARRGIEIPDVMEMTLYSRARGAPGAYRDDFPHPLDVENCEGRPPLILPACWH